MFDGGIIKGDETLRLLLETLTHFLNQDGVTDVFINAPFEIVIKNDQGRRKIKVETLSLAQLEQIAVAVGNYSNQSINKSAPILSATLPDGERIQVVLPPVVAKGTVSIAIRKPMPQVKSMAQYEAEGVFTDVVWLKPRELDLTGEQLDAVYSRLSHNDQHLINLINVNVVDQFLLEAIKLGKNIAVVGATGSGKTTFMKMLCQAIPKHEAIITIEDARELFLPDHPFVTHLTYSKGGQGQAKVTPAELIHSTMRMNPDRVLLAELRGSESYDYLKLLTSGHGGSITSWHAASPEEAMARFVLMAKEHPEAAAYQDVAIKRLLFTAIDIIVHLEARAVLNDEQIQIATTRKMTGIYFNPFKKSELAFETQQ
jgi:type IV secretion system protein VirB11